MIVLVQAAEGVERDSPRNCASHSARTRGMPGLTHLGHFEDLAGRVYRPRAFKSAKAEPSRTRRAAIGNSPRGLMLIMRNSICLTTALVLSLLSSLATAQTATNIICTSCVGPTDIATNAVTASEIAANAVTTEEIADGTVRSVDIANANVTSAKIANGTVALVDLSPALQALQLSAIATFSTLGTPSAAEGVVGAVCPSDRIVVSASCSCDEEGGTRNYGVLQSCRVQGSGAVAACFPDGNTYDPFAPWPLAIVMPLCLGATSVNGTPWLPTSTGFASTGTGTQASKMMTSEGEAQWHKQQQDEYEAALSELQNSLAIYRSRLSERQR